MEMSSGFPGGGPDFAFGGITGRSMMPISNSQGPYRSPLAGILPDTPSQILQRRSDLIGKRSLDEFQRQYQFQPRLQLHRHQQQGLELYLRNVKPRTFQHASPISPLSADFSASFSPEASSISVSSSTAAMNRRYGLPILQQLRPQALSFADGCINNINPSFNPNFSGESLPNLMPNREIGTEISAQESETKMMNRLQELEKQLLDDDNDEEGDAASVVTSNEWSETIQNLMTPILKAISPSPTSSSSSCSSSWASPPTVCPKQSITEVASAISEGKTEAAVEILTRLNQVFNVGGTSEQRLAAYMVSALRSRVNPTKYPPTVAELYGKEHTASTNLLYEASPCFKLGFMAANLAILEAISDHTLSKLHVMDFDIGQGGQYVHLLHALAARKSHQSFVLKITTFRDFVNGSEDRLRAVGDGLKIRANKVGISVVFNVMALNIRDLNVETFKVDADEILAVNFAFRLYRLPDESVTTENLRDELLRRVKVLSPAVVTVVEQEMNGNTASFATRVNEAWGYYAALFESLDSAVAMGNPDRVRIEEGLGRKLANSVACEGRDRVERCEVFGKWRARFGMAGFEPKPLSQHVANSLLTKLNSGPRGNPGFTVKEQTGGICFGWMGRSLTVVSAWR